MQGAGNPDGSEMRSILSKVSRLNATNRGDYTDTRKQHHCVNILGSLGRIPWNPKAGVLAFPWRAHWRVWPRIWALEDV